MASRGRTQMAPVFPVTGCRPVLYDAQFGCVMGRETLKIVLSLLGAGAFALCVLVLTQAILLSGHPHSRGAELFRFQLSSMFALAIFAGTAIVIYARLSRYKPRLTRGEPGERPQSGAQPKRNVRNP
jgi:hypothetical protein